MKAAVRSHVLFFTLVLMAVLGGCAEVHQNPASNLVNGQTDSARAQGADAQVPRQSSVAF